MNHFIRPGILAATCFCACLAWAAGAAHAEPGAPLKIDRVQLHDVHGLYGGHTIYLSADGTLWVQVVTRPAGNESGLQEKRYKLKCDPAQISALEKELSDHHFADIQTSQRPGVPDEAQPRIRLQTADGKVVEKSKWANDANADFTAIYQSLLALKPKPGAEKPVHSGKLDPAWHPEGFLK